MLRRIALRDFVIVLELELELEAGAGFSVLTGETGAGKSILIDALQLALGARGDAGAVREGAARAEIVAEFDTPGTLRGWLAEAGFDDGASLLLRRTLDAEGRSRAWVNGSAATITQLREVADHLVEIHGQHAWQSLTRPAAVRSLLDAQAGIDPAPLAAAWATWRETLAARERARQQRDGLERERERLQWQIGELARLEPTAGEWEEINSEHSRLANAQTLLDAARSALDAISEDEASADVLAGRAADALAAAARYDAELEAVAEVLQSAQAQLQDAARTLQSYLGHREPDPDRLTELDARLSSWVQLARRYRRQPAELPALLEGWRVELQALEASADLDTLERAVVEAERAFLAVARQVGAARRAMAPQLATAVTQAMQQLGMSGGRFEIALQPLADPQAHGLEQVEFLVAGHAGSSPRPLAKVASGGELSRLALAIAVTTARARATTGAVPTLIFDEVDAGVGGTVGDSVGRLLKQLGTQTQVLAVTHLAQVAACADAHFVVSKSAEGSQTFSRIEAVAGETRVAEIARMLGGGRLGSTSLAHAQAMLEGGAR
jgi:DNA repair protein RecN (Recombination protein N)